MLFSDREIIDESKRLFSSWLTGPAPRFRTPREGADLIVEFDRVRMVVELKRAGDASHVGSAAEQARAYAAKAGPKVLPVVGVPYMGEVGKRLCNEAGVCWFDFSGNADIAAPGLRIFVDGKPNQFVRRGRPATAFAPKSARIARHLLIHSSRTFRQQELATAVGLDDGFTSRIVRRLEEDRLIARDKERGIHVVSPERLLSAWSESYDFRKHKLLRGHISARSGEELLDRVGSVLTRAKARYAATGLAGAWLHTKHVQFRLATFYIADPRKTLLEAVKFRDEAKGANVWFAMPNDEGVFDGATQMEGISCAHPVQVFLDLRAHPERAQEAASELHNRLLTWERQ